MHRSMFLQRYGIISYVGGYNDFFYQVNSHSFSAFANTISFNVSRYPTLVEMTNSKDYEKQKSLNAKKDWSLETKVTTADALKGVKAGGLNMTTSSGTQLEYVPAEYFRGVENNSIQTGETSNYVKTS